MISIHLVPDSSVRYAKKLELSCDISHCDSSPTVLHWIREQVKSNVTVRRNHSAILQYSSREYITVEYSVIQCNTDRYLQISYYDFDGQDNPKLYLRIKVWIEYY